MKESMISAIKSLGLSGRTRSARYKRLLFFWNPFICAVFCVVLEPLGWPLVHSWIRSLLFADVTSSSVFFVNDILEILLMRHVAFLRASRAGKLRRLHSAILSALLMIPAFFPGYWAANLYSWCLGLPRERLDLRTFTFSILVGGVIMGLFYLTETVHDLQETDRESQLKLQMAENERLQAQIAALTAQMNPHFLFNALNTVASTIPVDPGKAEETTVQLAELYRGVLKASRQSSHALASELEIVRDFLAIEAMRYGSRLRYAVVVDSGLDATLIAIPVLTVQPLVENAVRHGLAPRAEGGEIKVDVRQTLDAVEIAVRDDGVGIDQATPASRGNGVGLANCRARLAYCYGEAARLTVEPGPMGGTVARLLIPRNVLQEVEA